MPIPKYVADIRKRIGHDYLLLPGITALVFNDAGEILLQRRSDTKNWAVIGGIVEPGEHPAAATVREVYEETGVTVVTERVTGIYITHVTVYPNGDHSQYVLTAFYCKVISGQPCVNDDESLEVAYFKLNALPPLREDHQKWIADAAADLSGAVF